MNHCLLICIKNASVRKRLKVLVYLMNGLASVWKII